MQKDHNPWESEELKNGSPAERNADSDRIISNSVPVQGNIKTPPVIKKSGPGIDVKRILSVWPYMALFGLLGFGLSWAYLRYTVKVYETQTRIVLENETETTLGQALFTTRDPLYNQVALIKSPAVTKRVVDHFQLQYHAFLKGKVKDRELFNELQWQILEPSPTKGNDGVLFFQIRTKPGGFDWFTEFNSGQGDWNKPVMVEGNKVIVRPNIRFPDNSLLDLFDADPWEEAEVLSNRLTVGTSKESNVIRISLRDNIPERAVGILNQIVPSYTEEAKISKSKSLKQSLLFVQDRLAPVAFELDSIETEMAKYKASRGLVGKESNGELYFSESLKDQAKLKEIELQTKILANAERYLSDPGTKPEFLAAPGIEEETLIASISTFHQLRAERERMANAMTERNPKLIAADQKVKNARILVDVQLDNYRKRIQIVENSAKISLNNSKSLLKSSPQEEKVILEQTRLQNIKQTLFLKLLEKREEIALSLAGVSVKTAVLSPPSLPKIPISPKPLETLAISMLAGLMLPVIVAVAAEIMNKKIVSKNQLQQMISVPVLGEIDQAEAPEGELVVRDMDRSVIGEQFRILRTNLNFYRKADKKTFYIMSTSSMSGEGKSFLSANLAASFAILGKRTALLEFDLRKPKLAERFKVAKGQGLVNVLMGDIPPSRIAMPIHKDHPLFLFPSGPIPPNPSELMAMNGMNVLKEYLDENFDVVIIDTPPYALVADSQLLEAWSDVTLFVVRFRKTLRDQVYEIEEAHQRGLFKNMAVIFNGIKMSGYYGYNYGYDGMKRKYGYNYYTRDGKRKKKK